jgi:WD40 repeat protein
MDLRLHLSNRKVLVRTTTGVHMLDTRIHRFLTHFTIPNAAKTSRTEKKPYPQPFGADYRHDLEPKSSLCTSIVLKCSFSACGEYVFAGTSDGKVAVWKSETGVFEAMYSSQTLPTWRETNRIVDISFHPLDHAIAFTVWGPGEPVLIYTFDDKTSELRSKSSKVHYMGSNQQMKLDHLVSSSLGEFDDSQTTAPAT